MLRWVRGVVVAGCLGTGGLATGAVSVLWAQNGAELTVMSHDALELVKVLTAQERDWNAGNLNAFLEGWGRRCSTGGRRWRRTTGRTTPTGTAWER